MGSQVFPTLQGVTWPIERSTNFRTLSLKALSNRVANVPLQPYPTHTYKLAIELLRDDVSTSEIKLLVGFFNACRGRWDSFLYNDPLFNTVSAMPFATGDGHSTAFQCTATFEQSAGPGGPDIVQNFNGVPSFFDAGSPVSPSVGPTGIISFGSAPVAGHVLTWTGSFYQRCHFTQDTLTVQQFQYRWWQCSELSFKSVLL